MSNALEKFPIDFFLPCRVIGLFLDKKEVESAELLNSNQATLEINVSLRESLQNEKNWQILSSKGTTLQYKKAFGLHESNGDLRNRILKLGPASLKEGMICCGYVDHTNDSGCYVNLGYRIIGRASPGELADFTIKNPSLYYFTNRLVIGNKNKFELN